MVRTNQIKQEVKVSLKLNYLKLMQMSAKKETDEIHQKVFVFFWE